MRLRVLVAAILLVVSVSGCCRLCRCCQHADTRLPPSVANEGPPPVIDRTGGGNPTGAYDG